MLDLPSEHVFEEAPIDVRAPKPAPVDIGDDVAIDPLGDDDIRQETEHLNAVLQQRIEEIETVFDVLPVGLGIADDSECRTIRPNPALAHILGVPLGTNISKLGAAAETLPFKWRRNGMEMAPEELPLHRAVRRGEDVEMTLELATADGRILTLWQSARALYDENGNVRGGLMAVTDVTDQTRDARMARFAMRASEVLVSALDVRKTMKTLGRLVVPHMADLFAVDLVSERGDIERVASRLANGTGFGESVLPPTAPFWQTPDHPANDVLHTGIPFFADGGEGAIAEMLSSRADHLAQWRALDLRSLIIVPIEARGRMLGLLTLATTASRRRFDRKDLAATVELGRRAAAAVDNARLLESAEGAREEAQRANRAKSDFLAAMSHELRTPLNAIAGYCQLMLLGLRGNVSDDQRDDLLRIEQNQRHLLGLINSILNFAKLGAGSVQYDVSDVPISELFASVQSMIGPQMRAKGLKYVQKPCSRDIFIKVDRDKARQVLLNLLSNAVKFTPSGGTITVGCKVSKSYATIYVRDTGVGIASDKLVRVFEPFVQVDRTLSTMHEGVGLGLAISRDLARGMGGDVTVASDTGRGSIFSIAFPIVQAQLGLV